MGLALTDSLGIKSQIQMAMVKCHELCQTNQIRWPICHSMCYFPAHVAPIFPLFFLRYSSALSSS